MRTILLLGVAAGSLLLAGHASSAERPIAAPHKTVDLAPGAGFADDPRPTLDYGAPIASDTRVYTGYPDRVPGEVDYRGGTDYRAPTPPDATFRGSYDAQGRWTGTWDGSFETADGHRYDGVYQGSVEGRPGIAYPQPYNPYYYNYGDYRGGTTGYQGGGYYGYGGYSPGAVVTTTINGPPIITETVETTTRTYYETVPVRKRYVARKKPRPRCAC